MIIMSDYKNKVIKIFDIWDLWSERIANMPEIYSLSCDAGDIFDDTFLTYVIETDYLERSFINRMENPVYGIERLWIAFRYKHDTEFINMFNTLNIEYNPLNTYSETKIISPNITAATTNTYGRTSTNSGGTSNAHGHIETKQINTYNGSLRDGEKITHSGTDSVTDTRVNTLGGTDSSSTTTSGSSTETITGYKESPVIGLERDIAFKIRYNVADNYVKAFIAECTFFDNDNAKGGHLFEFLY